MHLPVDFIFELWHLLDASAVVEHGAVLAALLLKNKNITLSHEILGHILFVFRV